MRAYLRTKPVSRRYWLMMGVFALSIANPSVTTAVPFEPLLSGALYMETPLGGPVGGGFVTTLHNDKIGFSFNASSNGRVGPTGASVVWHQIGTYALTVGITTHTGEVFNVTCGPGLPSHTQPCTYLGTLFSMAMTAPTPNPPQPGDELTTTVDGTFHLTLNATVSFLDFQNQPGFGFLTENEGPASLTFNWDPSVNNWRFESGEAHFLTPEPATLLLFGTTAAGLGLARWYRRRASERGHAA